MYILYRYRYIIYIYIGPIWNLAAFCETYFTVPLGLHRVPTQVLQSLIKSYICFSICKALQSLIFGVFLSKRSYKVLFLKEKKVSVLEM